MSPSESAQAVPLPRRRDSLSASFTSANTNKPPVWSIDERAAAEPAPLPAKCDRHIPGREGVCCKELRDVDERTLIDPDVVRDVVIGLSDGLTVPFALTAGLSSLGESRLVILGGFAELIAGALSMGIGGFLASQAERDHYLFLKKCTESRVQRCCDGEMEREVYGVLGPIGVDEKTSRMVARSLKEVELATGGDGSSVGSGAGPEEAGLKWSKTVGLTAFLLKFGEGLEEIPTRRMYISAFTIGLGYLLGGFVPLLPYFFIPVAHIALIYSCIITAGAGIGGYVWGAVSMLLVGGAAAAAAYGLVAALEG
ncbi:unnamed protein product [Somion occarium]|uniref:DUF125-domain-containing protein n=1 Tax=Somion occarium TaxID=3059160 RepID=A0ABP1DRZ6_9APHY